MPVMMRGPIASYVWEIQKSLSEFHRVFLTAACFVLLVYQLSKVFKPYVESFWS